MKAPTEEDILLIKDKRDPYFKEALDHASDLMGLREYEHQKKIKSHARKKK